MAAPFGPPPSVATTWILPSGVTRDSVWRWISTRMTEPSGIATGPSGNRRPDVICFTAGVIVAIVTLLGRVPHGAAAARAAIVSPHEPVDSGGVDAHDHSAAERGIGHEEASMPRVGSVRAKIHERTVHKTPAKIYDIKTAPKAGTPRRVATSFLSRIARDLKIRVSPKELRYDKTVKTVLGSHVLFQQYRRGKPVSGAWLKVDLDKDNRIYSVENTTVPATLLDKVEQSQTKAKIDARTAVERALAQLQVKISRKGA